MIASTPPWLLASNGLIRLSPEKSLVEARQKAFDDTLPRMKDYAVRDYHVRVRSPVRSPAS